MKHELKRLFIDADTPAREREKIIYLAVENGCNTLVFSLNDKFFTSKFRHHKYIKLINTHALRIEAGGSDFSLFLPRRLFSVNRELFRMDQGVQKSDFHFCPTNPKTISIIMENALVLFNRVLDKVTPPRIFHLLPEKGHEETWCACPACRAFSPAEQYLIAVNTVADSLIKVDMNAKISYIDFDTEPDAEGISPKKNVIVNTSAKILPKNRRSF